MNFNIFISTVKKEIERRMSGEVTLRVCKAIKNNGVEKTGLAFQKEEERLSPTIYMEEYYQQFEDGMAMEEVIVSILNLYHEIRYTPDWDAAGIESFEQIKSLIAYRLIGREKNLELLEEVPHRDYLDMAVVYYLLLEVGSHGSATMMIRNEHLEMWQVTQEEIFRYAAENTARLLPAEFKSMETVLKELELQDQVEEAAECETEEGSMYVLSNEIRSFGASVILYDQMLQNLADKIKESFYVLPSSVHEVIIVPESKSMESVELEAMVTEINETQVEDEEILSNRVYFYDKEKEPELKIVRHKFTI
ncbi:MAG: DUF5688 family protein [Lachnospiraceae bacterium]